MVRCFNSRLQHCPPLIAYWWDLNLFSKCITNAPSVVPLSPIFVPMPGTHVVHQVDKWYNDGSWEETAQNNAFTQLHILPTFICLSLVCAFVVCMTEERVFSFLTSGTRKVINVSILPPECILCDILSPARIRQHDFLDFNMCRILLGRPAAQHVWCWS